MMRLTIRDALAALGAQGGAPGETYVKLFAERTRSDKQPRLYGDYREMLKEKDLDIVLVGSPDHWHALHAIAAIESGADVYCQKPISADVSEGGAMLDAARKHKRVVQIGTQRKSTPHLIDAKKQVVEAGLLGVLLVHVEQRGESDVANL